MREVFILTQNALSPKPGPLPGLLNAREILIANCVLTYNKRSCNPARVTRRIRRIGLAMSPGFSTLSPGAGLNIILHLGNDAHSPNPRHEIPAVSDDDAPAIELAAPTTRL